MANHDQNSEFTAEVPSNIALVKYWGKRDPERQWPANDSLSMTLNAARTITTARLHHDAKEKDKDKGDVLLRADMGGELQPVTGNDKALRHLAYLRGELKMPAALHISTKNTFPSGCGIASSASGLGALTLAAISAWTGARSLAELAAGGFDLPRLAELARLGSGSACRSFFGGYCLWTAGAEPESQSVMQVYDEDHWPLADLIVIVSPETKSVSSSAGHLTTASSPLFKPRVAGIPARMRRVRAALAARDLDALGVEIEAEALDMHAVMMTATPSLRYLLGGSVDFLSWLRKEREETGLPAYFTIDAGPNIHVICDFKDTAKVSARINAAFPQLAIIADRTGAGPTLTWRPLP